MNPQYSQESLDRLKKLERMQNLGISPYASKYDTNHTCAQLGAF